MLIYILKHVSKYFSLEKKQVFVEFLKCCFSIHFIEIKLLENKIIL